jgi:hypothetical protein
MRVFISWSGERSKTVATKLKWFIRLVLPQADPWVSVIDISAGARWSAEVAKALDDTRFGVICVTPDNQRAPWLQFEAGACAKKVADAFVCPYLIGMADETALEDGPLSAFQGRMADSSGTKDLLFAINKAMGTVRSEEEIKALFDKFYPELDETIRKAPGNIVPARRGAEEMLEDILTTVRSIDRRVEGSRQEEKLIEVPNDVVRPLLREWVRGDLPGNVFREVAREAPGAERVLREVCDELFSNAREVIEPKAWEALEASYRSTARAPFNSIDYLKGFAEVIVREHPSALGELNMERRTHEIVEIASKLGVIARKAPKARPRKKGTART